ncbi:hypothetical protein [Sinorhizobium medicae]|uniref:hypothetical protein n=1 Tax=Sinorhizobium medicae TaxID=110321 RepID=UPI0012955213|nr:hypothetical protein [Sinorhizobium medicae]MQX45743.1 hypothetical protein [Sinorhizobium medicae]
MVGTVRIGLIALLLSFATATDALAENLKLPATSKWVVVASRETFEEARQVAKVYETVPEGARIVRSKNGRFAIILGPTTNYDLEARKAIPADSYLSSGSNLLETVWTAKVELQGIPPTQAVAAVPDHSVCKAIDDDMARLACHDRLDNRSVSSRPDSGANSDFKATSAEPRQANSNPTVSPANAVTPASATLRHRSQDYESDVMHDRIDMRVSFTNHWPIEVVGVSHRFRILNAFGEVLHQGADNLDIRVPSGQTASSEIFYIWNNNPFIPGEVYDRLLGAVTNGTYKVEVQVQKAILANGQALQIASAP